MAHLISFRTAAFDPNAEPENPINPIRGQSALMWLRQHALGDRYESTDPDYEDWGWYIDVHGDESSYLVGAICYDDADDGVYDWTIQVVKRRRFGDVLRRRNQMTQDDPLTSIIADAFRNDARVLDISVDYGQ